jgi:hypothetical protein
MLELIKFFLEKLDFLAIAEVLRKRKNRQLAARLHAILVQSIVYCWMSCEPRWKAIGVSKTDIASFSIRRASLRYSTVSHRIFRSWRLSAWI